MRLLELIKHLIAVEHTRGNILVLIAHPQHEGTAFGIHKGDVGGIKRDASGKVTEYALILKPYSEAHASAPGIILPTGGRNGGQATN